MTNKQFIVIAVLLAVVAFGSFLGKQTSGVLGSYSPLQNTQPYGLYSNVTSTKLIATGAGNVAGIIVCAHNHPSANITPSTQDKEFTKELCGAGKLMEIKVLDHVIIGDDKYYSFADEGLMV